jgi:hypothetical protein
MHNNLTFEYVSVKIGKLIKHKLFYHISVLFNCKKIIPMWILQAPCRFHRLHYCILHKDTSHCIFTHSIINDNFSLCPILQLFHTYVSHIIYPAALWP